MISVTAPQARTIAFLILSGCGKMGSGSSELATAAQITGRNAQFTSSTASDRRSTFQPWDARSCGNERPDANMRRHPKLMGRTPDALASVFGKAATEQFRIGDAVGTLRSGLGSLLPGGEAGNRDRIAREDTWTKSGCSLTVFSVENDGAWRAIDSITYSADADF